MKGIIRAILIFSASNLIITTALADNMNKNHGMMMKSKHMKWMCETNASSSTTDADKKADAKMAAGEKSAKAAFDYAYKHCRDCTKITCSTQDNTQ